MCVKSISSKRSVFATAPIQAAVVAIGIELLNIIEKPNTPQKLVIILNTNSKILLMCIVVKSCGCSFNRSAIIQANIVATNIIIIEYVNRSRPERKSSLARSMPLVINGKPGIINNMEHIYPASCTWAIPSTDSATLKQMA